MALSEAALQYKERQRVINESCGCGLPHCAMCGMERRPGKEPYGVSGAEPFTVEEGGELYCRFCDPWFWDNPDYVR